MPWDPETRVCSTTPRFSYSVLKVTVPSGPHCSTGGPDGWVRAGYGTRDGYTGWVYRVGNTVPREYPAARSQLPEEQAQTAERAP